MILTGDCLQPLRDVPDESVHVIVTDPPYVLSDLPADQVMAVIAAWAAGDHEAVPGAGAWFMGADWDRFVPPPAVWAQRLRVRKTGRASRMFRRDPHRRSHGVVLDPFARSGTTIEAAIIEQVCSIGIEQNPDYVRRIGERVRRRAGALF